MLVVKDTKRLKAFGFSIDHNGDLVNTTFDNCEHIIVEPDGSLFVLLEFGTLSDNTLDALFDLFAANLIVKVTKDEETEN